MNPRQVKAVEIASRFKIQEKEGKWVVPSQSKRGSYSVGLNGTPRCTCPDFDTRGVVCKHIMAVQITIEERYGDGTKIVKESVSVTGTVKRTYTQNWTTYNNSQVNEKDQFQVLLKDLVNGVPEPARNKTGRKPIPVSDALFAAAFKVYSTVSGRRFMSDLREAHKRGFIRKVPHFNSVFNVLRQAGLTEILQGLVTKSSLPLATVERSFAVDASGFSTSRFDRWVEYKWGKKGSRREWLKAHLMCGTQTNIVTAAQITDGKRHDAPFLPPLLGATAQYFPVEEVSADKGYLSRQNVNAIAEAGAVPFIAFKSNSKPEDKITSAWNQMFHHFNTRQEEFMAHYHRRSNVETAFSMIKRKFGDSLRSKCDTSMINEALCKILCHNIVVVIHEMYELGIRPDFGTGVVHSRFCAES